MALNGSPGGPPAVPDDDHSDQYPGVEETQYANYGGSATAAYSESYDHIVAHPQSRAWYQKPAGLIGLGVLTAAMLALLVYAVVDFRTAETSRPAVTTVTSTAVPQSSATADAPVTTPSEPSTTTNRQPETTAAEPPAPRTPATIIPSVTTVTETAIERRFPRLPNRLNPPTLYETAPGQ